MSRQVKRRPFSGSSHGATWLHTAEYDIKNCETDGQIVNYIPAVILIGEAGIAQLV